MADFYGKMKEERMKSAAAGNNLPKYKVLQADLIKASEKAIISGVAGFVSSGDEAYKLAGHDGFSYFGLDVRGRVGVVMYKGKEVLLLFRREVVEIEPGPADPVPSKQIKLPAEAWLQVDLLSTDEPVAQKGILAKLKQITDRFNRVDLLWKDEERQRKGLEEDLQRAKKDLVSLPQMRLQLEVSESETKRLEKVNEQLAGKLRIEESARRDDRMKTIRELFPVFNTLWLAAIHKTGDPVYAMLQKQLMEALDKVGAELVEPKIGEEFDPQLHHAIHSFPFDKGRVEIGTVVQVHKAGWKLKGGPLVEAAVVGVGIEKEEKENADAGVSAGQEMREGNV